MRQIILLLLIQLQIELSAFTPTSFRSSASLSGGATKRSFIRTFTSVSTSEIGRHPVITKKGTRASRVNKKGEKFNEFQWLNWVYCQWRSTKPGQLDENTLKQMIPAIASWGRRKTIEGADRAEELLERIIEENLAGNASAELSVSMFNSAMQAHAKVGNPEGVHRLLQRMHQLRKQHHHLSYLQPDNFSMSTLATAWAKSRSPQAAKKAEAILDYMEVRNMVPTTITYNAVLNALAYGKEVDKALRIEDLVNRMKERSEKGDDCEPDIYSYQSLIQALSKTPLFGSPQKAEQILLFLDEQSERGNKKLKPNSYCFTCKASDATIHAWAKSKEKKKARSAYEIFNRMKKRYLESKSRALKPNVVVFTAVLNACAWPESESEKEEAFEIARLTMEELSLGVFDKPNFLSFAAFLCVCSSTLDQGEVRDRIVRDTFEQCARRGQVAGIVLDKFKTAASPNLYRDLLDGYRGKEGLLVVPFSWNKNVQGERRGEAVHRELEEKCTNLTRESKLRLKEIQGFRGKSGCFSGKGETFPEDEGIVWSRGPSFGNMGDPDEGTR
eukprot:scaffold13478_cov132-Cylindrotheca_fusiformis.AAC.15